MNHSSAATFEIPLRHLGNVQDANFGLHEDFKVGLVRLGDRKLGDALKFFKSARKASDPTDVYKNKYASYQGLLMIMTGDMRGIDIVRYAAHHEQHDIDVIHALAHAEHAMGNRREALAAVSRGLSLDPRHPGLRELRCVMGVRSKPTLPFLKREHPVNRMLGRWRCGKRER